MDLESIFVVVALGVTPAWALLIIAPHWDWTNRIVHGMWIPLVLCALWVVVRLLKPVSLDQGGLGSLSEFLLLINNPYGALLLWIQLLAWDLFIGAWLARDARRHGISHAWIVPSLLLTFLLGPVGLLLYLLTRFVLKGAVSIREIDFSPQKLSATP